MTFFHNEALFKLNVEGRWNILDEAFDALEKKRLVQELHVINMPSFKIDTNMDVQKYLRMVSHL